MNLPLWLWLWLWSSSQAVSGCFMAWNRTGQADGEQNRAAQPCWCNEMDAWLHAGGRVDGQDLEQTRKGTVRAGV